MKKESVTTRRMAVESNLSIESQSRKFSVKGSKGALQLNSIAAAMALCASPAIAQTAAPSASEARISPSCRFCLPLMNTTAVIWSRRTPSARIESMVRSDEQRRLLFDTDMSIIALRSAGNANGEGNIDSDPVVQLTGCYHNLLRMWADT